MRLRTAAWALLSLVTVGAAPNWALDGRKPGSVLIYPIHRSTSTFTILSVTNTALESTTQFVLGGGTSINWQFLNVIPGAFSPGWGPPGALNLNNDPLTTVDCQIIDRGDYLTPGDTTSILATCYNPGNREGFVLVTSQDPNFYKTDWSHNFLVGSELVVNERGGVYSLNAIPFKSPQPRGSHTDSDDPTGGFSMGKGDGDGQIDFDGVEYEGVPDDLYADVFFGINGSSLTLLNLSGGRYFTATVGLDIWNDNEHPLSATFQFRCWMEEQLVDLSQAFDGNYLRANTPHDPEELDVDCDEVGDIETGWFRVRGLDYSSTVDTCLNPALLGAITAGPDFGGIINGGHLLWESKTKQINGDFYKFASDDPECPEPVPMPPVCVPGTDQMVNLGDPVIFDGSASFDEDGVIVDYHWDFGDGNQGRTAIVPHVYAAPGTYFATLTVRDDDDLESFCTITVVVNAPPLCDAGPTQTATLGDSVTFDAGASSDPDGTIVQYDWDFGDGSPVLIDGGPTPTHTYATEGSYLVTLTVTDNKGFSSMCQTTAEINKAPDCDAGPTATGNEGGSFDFDGSNSFDADGTVEQYDWDFGDGSPVLVDGGPTPSHVYTDPGTYTVKLTITDDDGAMAMCFTEAEVNAFPECDAGPTATGNEGDSFDFDGSGSFDSDGTVVQYDWDYGDGSPIDVDAGPTPSHVYNTPGTFTVTLKITDDKGAMVECETTAEVNALPTCDAGPTATGNEGDSFDFDGSGSFDSDGTVVQYDWDFGDGSPVLVDGGPTPSHVYADPGTYTVKLTITDDQGAMAMCFTEAEVNAFPECDAGPSQSGNVGDTISFDASGSFDSDGTIVQYDWLFGDGTGPMLDLGPTPSHTYNTPGEFTVTVKITDDKGAFVNCSTTVSINAFPDCDAGPTATGNEGDSFSFDGSGSFDSDGTVVQYDWDYGDGSPVDVDAGPTPSHVYTDPGTYTVTLKITDDDGAMVTCTTTAEVNAFPECDAGPTATGNVGDSFDFDGSGSFDSDGTVVQYDWDYGDGSPVDVDAGPTPSHVYNTPGTFTVTLKITDDKGAMVTCTTTAEVNAFPECDAGPTATGNAGDSFDFDGSNSFDSDGTVVQYDWDYGDGSPVDVDAGPTPSHVYANPGTYTVTLKITDDDGAMVTCETTAEVNAFPDCDAGPTATGNAGDSFDFDGSGSFDSDGTVVQYDWDFGDGSPMLIDGGPTPSHVYANPGIYTVTLKITDDDGAMVTCTTMAEVNAFPECDAGPTATGNAGDSFDFDGSGSFDSDGTVVQYDWDFGDGSPMLIDGGPTPSHVYANPGTYTVTLKITDDDGAMVMCTTTAEVNAFPECVAGPTATGNAGDSFDFDGSSSFDPDGTVVQYDWDFGDGSPVLVDGGPTPSHVYTDAGTYTVKLTITDDQGATSMCFTEAQVNALPICDAGPDQSVLAGEVVQFDASGSFDPDGTVVTYDWTWGDGTPQLFDGGPTPTHVFVNPGTFTVRLKITDDSGAISRCKLTVFVNAPPNCDAGPPVSGNVGDRLMFDGSGSNDPDGVIVSYDWNFGDGRPGAMNAGPMPVHAYSAPGVYVVTLTVTDDSGASIACTTTATVNDPPVCDAGPTATGNAGGVFNFDGSNSFDTDGTIVSYDWDFGDGSPLLVDGGPTPTHVYTDPGTYEVTLTVTDDFGAVAVCMTTAEVNAFPVCVAGPTATGNLGDTFDFDGSNSFDPDGNVVQYDWNFGDGSPVLVDGGPMPSYTYADFGSFTVTLTITDDQGATSNCTTMADVNRPPNCDAGPPKTANVGESVLFSSVGSNDRDGMIVDAEWDFGDGSPPMSGPTVTHAYAEAGEYVVTLKVTDDDGAMSICTTIVVVNEFPVCVAGPDQTGNVGDTIFFDASNSFDPDGTVTQYNWDFGDGTPLALNVGPTPSHTYNSAGTFTVTVTVIDDDFAQVMCTLEVEINAFPICDAGPILMETLGNSVTFDATGSSDPDGMITQYDWDYGDGSPVAVDAGPMPTHTYATFGTFDVKLTVTDEDGASTMCFTQVEINAPPLCNAGLPDPPSADLGELITFDGTGSMDPDGMIVSYEWDFGDGSPPAFGPIVTHAYTQPGMYVVLLTITDDDGASLSCGLLQGAVVNINDPPVCDAGGPYDGDLFDEIMFDGTGSMDRDGTIVSYDWDYGDGSLVDFDAGATPKHVYTQPGTFTVTLTVTDDFGTSVVCTTEVNIVDVSGAIVFSGDDSDEHCPSILCGSMPATLIQWVLDHSNTQGEGILALGLQESALPAFFSLADENFQTWLALLDDPGIPVRRVVDPDELTDPGHPDYIADFDAYEMIYVPSFEQHTVGGITQEMLNALATRTADIDEYIYRRGGGMFVLTQAEDADFDPPIANGYTWSPVPFQSESQRYFFVIPAPFAGTGDPANNIAPPLPTQTANDLSHEAWHNTFLPDPILGFGGLEVFVEGDEAGVFGEAAIIGGVPDPPSFPIQVNPAPPRLDRLPISSARNVTGVSLWKPEGGGK